MKNFKKVISVVMALAMIISSFTAVSAAKFADVADTAAYTEAVEVLAALGVVNGVPQENGTFNFEPEKSVTRAEAATMIVGALNMADDAKAAAGTSQFGDVNSQAAWAAGFVNVGVAQGFINGYDANTFGPLDNVTYAQMCVMLTQIIGYGDYAKAYGGWPTGYTTMAANAGINAGVAVATDADLTKGQVAMMIWNALQAPLLGVSEYAIDGNVYKPQNGKNGAEYKTLFTEKFDGFTAKITITGTPLTMPSDENIVDFTIVKSDWWLPEEHPSDYVATGYSFPSAQNDIEFVEGVDVNANHLQTGTAVFVLNEDDEPSMIYFKAAERTASKEFAADTYVMQADTVISKRYSNDYLKLKFGSSFYTFDPKVQIYVNGVEYTDAVTYDATPATHSTYALTYDPYTPAAGNTPAVRAGYKAGPKNTTDATLTGMQALLDNVLGSAHGTIKVLKVNSDSTGYDTIFVKMYQVAEVIGVDVGNDATTISLATVANYLNSDTEDLDEIVIDKEAVEEEKTTVKVTKNGEEAELSSLAMGDIIAYSCAFYENGSVPSNIENPKEIDIVATNDKISGLVTSKADQGTTSNLYDDEYTIGGATYKITPNKTGVSVDINKSYDITLDPFGNIYKAKANAESTNYAIALKLTSDGDGIRLLLADGTTKTYEIDDKLMNDFNTNFVAWDHDGDGTDTSLGQTAGIEIDRVANVKDRIVEYAVSGKTGKLIKLARVGTAAMSDEYKTKTGLLGGGNKILDNTPIIYIDSTAGSGYSYYNNAAQYSVLTKSDLVDQTSYTAHVTKIPSSTTVGFVVVTVAGKTFGESSRFAVAIDAPAKVLTDDGDEVYSVKVLYNGEVQELLFAITNNTSAADNLGIGDVFFFETDSDGYVKAVYEYPTDISAVATTWNTKVDGTDWAYDIWEPTVAGKDIQIAKGVVTEVTSDSISFATVAQVTSGSLNTTIDLNKSITWTVGTDDPATTTIDEGANVGNGVVTYGFANDCVAYTKDNRMETMDDTERFDVTTPASIKASRFAIFDAHDSYDTTVTPNVPNGELEDGKYANQQGGETMLSKANIATVMIVDGEIVAIYVEEN